MHKKELLAFFLQHKWQILGALGGLVFCILVFVINFWRTLVLFAVVAALSFLGALLDEGGVDRVQEFFSRLFRKK